MSTDSLRDPLGFEEALGKGGDSGAAAAAAANAASKREIAELKRQFNITQGNIQPFLDAGTSQLPALLQGTTAGGLDQRLGDIFSSEQFGNLRDERTRAVQGQLGAAGFQRSGTALQEIANVPTSLGFDIENLLSSRSSELAGSGQNAAVGLGALGSETSARIGASIAGQGQSTASGILADQQANAQASQNLLSAGIGAAAIFFSDPKLKENVEEISILHIKDPQNPEKIIDLPLVQWDWVAAAKGTMIEKCGTIGFMADRVKEIYPQHVHDFCGLMTVDYPAVYNELENQ